MFGHRPTDQPPPDPNSRGRATFLNRGRSLVRVRCRNAHSFWSPCPPARAMCVQSFLPRSAISRLAVKVLTRWGIRRPKYPQKLHADGEKIADGRRRWWWRGYEGAEGQHVGQVSLLQHRGFNGPQPNARNLVHAATVTFAPETMGGAAGAGRCTDRRADCADRCTDR